MIDLGNTNCKVAFEKDGVLTEVKRGSFGEDVSSFILSSLGDKKPEVIVFSNVREDKPALVEELKKRCNKLVILDYRTELPLDLNYRFPAAGLGADRIAGALATTMMFPGRDCIKFDFGTALTVDFIDKNGTFLGGNISLGLTSRFRALNIFTKRLPLIKPEGDFPDIGVDTEGAMTAVDRTLCKMLQKSLAKKDPSEYEPWMRALMRAAGKSCDWTDPAYLQPLLTWLGPA